MKNKPNMASPWVWTLLVSGLAAVLVASAGLILARRIDHIAAKPQGNRVDDSFRETARRIGVLEGMWQAALEEESKRMLRADARQKTLATIGVVQCSWLNPGFSDPGRAHDRLDGRDALVKPVLDRFSKGDASEWVFSEGEVISGSGWVEMPGRPLAWRKGNGKTAVVLLLNPLAAAEAVERDLISRDFLKLPADEPGSLSWTAPGGRVLLNTGRTDSNAQPDEILRHVSRFGDWTLRRFYPVTTVVSWRVPVLAGSFALAVLLLAGGVAVAIWQRKAIRVAEERVSFVNRVSHELRTPLTNLLLNTDLAIDGLSADDAKARRRLGLIREETSRLSRIVDNVLAFARIERGTMESRRESCEVTAVLEELRETFAPLFERKSIVCEYENRVSSRVGIDRDAFSQILSNLLSNIEKYAGESAKARVIIDGDESELAVEVTDSGPGIPLGARQRVFLPFERAGSWVNEGATGTGLGLAISRELAVRMGGRLELAPSEAGACFRLVLPLGERSVP